MVPALKSNVNNTCSMYLWSNRTNKCVYIKVKFGSRMTNVERTSAYIVKQLRNINTLWVTNSYLLLSPARRAGHWPCFLTPTIPHSPRNKNSAWIEFNAAKIVWDSNGPKRECLQNQILILKQIVQLYVLSGNNKNIKVRIIIGVMGL